MSGSNATNPPEPLQISAADIAAYKQQQVAAAAHELETVMQRYRVKIIAQPELTPDGRLTALVRLVYNEE